MDQKVNKLFCVCFVAIFVLSFAYVAKAHQPEMVKTSPVVIKDPEISMAFYAELKGEPQIYTFETTKDFNLYINLLVPQSSNPNGIYNVQVYRTHNDQRDLFAILHGPGVVWTKWYEEYAGDWYLKGPEFKTIAPAGQYEIRVYNNNNQGKYVLAVGEKEVFGPKSVIAALTVLPVLKISFFHTSIFKLFTAKLGIIYWIAVVVLILAILIIRAVVLRQRFRHLRT